MADNLNFNWGITINLANVGAVAGTGSSFTSTAATQAVNNGKFGTPLGAQTNAAIPTVDAGTTKPFVTLQPNQCCSLVFGVNTAGALQLCQGTVLPTGIGSGTTAGVLLNAPQFPGLPRDFCPLAYTVVTTSPSATPWTPGSSSWTASGVVATPFANVAQLPNRPRSS